MNTVQTLWIGDRLTDTAIISLKSFISHGFDVHVYAYQDIKNIPDKIIIKDGKNILPETDICYYEQPYIQSKASLFSNLFRYEILNQIGGMWIDTDVVCVQNFDIERNIAFVQQINAKLDSEGKPIEFLHESYASYIIKSMPNQEFLKFCINEFRSRQTSEKSIRWGETGPHLLTRSINQFKLQQYSLPIQQYNPIGWHEVRKYTDGSISYNDILFNNTTKTMHLWNELWSRLNLYENPIQKNSIFNTLKEMYL